MQNLGSQRTLDKFALRLNAAKPVLQKSEFVDLDAVRTGVGPLGVSVFSNRRTRERCSATGLNFNRRMAESCLSITSVRPERKLLILEREFVDVEASVLEVLMLHFGLSDSSLSDRF